MGQIFTAYKHKQPSEIKRYGVNFSNEFADGEVLSSATYVLIDLFDNTDKSSTMIVTSSEQISDQDSDGNNETASCRIQAGSDGGRYKLTILGTTDLGNKYEGDIIISVKNL